MKIFIDLSILIVLRAFQIDLKGFIESKTYLTTIYSQSGHIFWETRAQNEMCIFDTSEFEFQRCPEKVKKEIQQHPSLVFNAPPEATRQINYINNST